MVGTGQAMSVLRRKAGAGRMDTEAPADPAPVAALRRAFARAAHGELRLSLSIPHLTVREVSLAELLDAPEPCALLAVLEGQEEALGLLALGPEVLSAIVQVQTTGQVRPMDGSPRRPTRTDAAMCAGLIDRTLTEFEAALANTPDVGWAGGYRYASFLNEARPLGLLLEDIPFRLLRIEVTLAGGAMTGQALLALPSDGRRRRRSLGSGTGGNRESDRREAQACAAWASRLEATVLNSQTELRAVLHRMRVPLAELSRWAPGTILTLPLARLDGVRLEAAGDALVSTADLGKSRGFRAVRLKADTSVSHVAPEPKAVDS